MFPVELLIHYFMCHIKTKLLGSIRNRKQERGWIDAWCTCIYISLFLFLLLPSCTKVNCLHRVYKSLRTWEIVMVMIIKLFMLDLMLSSASSLLIAFLNSKSPLNLPHGFCLYLAPFFFYLSPLILLHCFYHYISLFFMCLI